MKKYRYNLSHTALQSLSMGELRPVLIQETVPGGQYRISHRSLVRMAATVAPVFHKVIVRLHSFYVPYRIIWADWPDYIMGNVPNQCSKSSAASLDGHPEDWNSASDWHLPAMNFGQTSESVRYFADAFGYALTAPSVDKWHTSGNPDVSALILRAYRAIINRYYLDPDVDTPLVLEYGSTPLFYRGNGDFPAPSNTEFQRHMAEFNDANKAYGYDGIFQCRWPKDRFTTARPQPQAGDGGFIPLETHNGVQGISPEGIRMGYRTLREQERRSRMGAIHRYSDFMAAMYGQRPSDTSIQEPQCIGRSSFLLDISEVLSTGGLMDTKNGGDATGTMRGHGIGAKQSRAIRKFSPEHGLIMCFASVMPQGVYNDYVPRVWTRGVPQVAEYRTDGVASRYFYEPVFYPSQIGLGSEPIWQSEVGSYWPVGDGGKFGIQKVFGWQQRHDDYRRSFNRNMGEFRKQTGRDWTFSRVFSDPVALNSQFLKCDPVKTPFVNQAKQNNYQFLGYYELDIKARLPIPYAKDR